jgi:hypothetical protein
MSEREVLEVASSEGIITDTYPRHIRVGWTTETPLHILPQLTSVRPKLKASSIASATTQLSCFRSDQKHETLKTEVLRANVTSLSDVYFWSW